MRKRRLIPIVIILSLAFNLGFALLSSMDGGVIWPFFELGPAVLQDSYLSRASSLESLYGMIGDVPGGYSLYDGNPLQIINLGNHTYFSDSSDLWILLPPALFGQYLIIGVLFAVVPFVIIFILGRRSYGSTKTQ